MNFFTSAGVLAQDTVRSIEHLLSIFGDCDLSFLSSKQLGIRVGHALEHSRRHQVLSDRC